MNPIATIEDAIIAAVQATLGTTVREVESLPGGWTQDMLRRALQFAPGVYVAFHGGNGKSNGMAYVAARFSVYCVTKGADDLARRRGTSKVIGGYDLVCLLAPVLNGLDVPDIGTLGLLGIDNLFRDAMFDLGGTVYSIQLELPNMDLNYQADLTSGDFADFTDWHAEHYNPGGIAAGEAPLAIDEVHA